MLLDVVKFRPYCYQQNAFRSRSIRSFISKQFYFEMGRERGRGCGTRGHSEGDHAFTFEYQGIQGATEEKVYLCYDRRRRRRKKPFNNTDKEIFIWLCLNVIWAAMNSFNTRLTLITYFTEKWTSCRKHCKLFGFF